MQWLVVNAVRPVASRIGGQVAAAAVALGLAEQHEMAVAAFVAWVLVFLAELMFSVKSRSKALDLAKKSWGRN